MDHILYQIFRTILSASKKKNGENIDNPSIRTFVTKVENRSTFQFEGGYYLELLTSKTMKLLGSTEIKVMKNKMVKMYVIYRLQK